MSIKPRSFKQYQAGDVEGSLFEILDGDINDSLSIPIIGKELISYADEISTSQTWLLEHFASTSGPVGVPGQLWFNSDNETLNVYIEVIDNTDPLNPIEPGGVWKQITPLPFDALLTNKDILPIEDSTYVIGNEENIWGSLNAENIYAGQIYFRDGDNFISIRDALMPSSDDVLYTSNHPNFPANAPISDVLDSIQGALSISLSFETITEDTTITPIRNRVYIVDSDNDVTITINPVYYSGESRSIDYQTIVTAFACANPRPPTTTETYTYLETGGGQSEINGFTFTISKYGSGNVTVNTASNDVIYKLAGTSVSVNDSATFKLASTPGSYTAFTYTQDRYIRCTFERISVNLVISDSEVHIPEDPTVFQEWTVQGDYSAI